jgi:hypothetical protein
MTPLFRLNFLEGAMFKQISVLIVLLICLVPVMVLAGSGAGAINMTFNTSARAEAMGSSGVAVTWGEDTNHWANPALLAFRPGINYTSFETQLAAGLADDIWLTNEEITFGAYGVTFLLAKGPMDGNFLDMGVQESIDENGVSQGEFQTYMKSESMGVGADLVSVLEHFKGQSSGVWTRYVSLAGGVNFHEFEDQLSQETIFGGVAGGSAMSMGYVARVTPVDMSRGAGFMNNGLLGFNISGSYGASILNKTDDDIRHMDADQSDPFPRMYVSGWGANAQITLADDMRETLNDYGFGFLGDMINPLVSFTKTEQLIEPGFLWNEDTQEYDYEHDTSGDQEEKGRGWELGLMNILYYRGGHVLAEWGDIDEETEGGGWKIQAGRFGGFTKDWAEVPQAEGLPNVRRESWSVWVDPLAIYTALYSR